MFKRTFQRIPRLVRVLIIVAIVLLADRLLWPRYSRERHIDPEDVVVAVLPNELREVHSKTEPRLLKRLIRALNEFLALANTSCYESIGDDTIRLFNESRNEPETYLKGTTGALLVLDPPLAMHTTLTLSLYPTVAEYHEFKARRIFLSDSISPQHLKAVGFSSNEEPGMFYLFDAQTLPRWSKRDIAKQKWDDIIRAIESAVSEARPSPR